MASSLASALVLTGATAVFVVRSVDSKARLATPQKVQVGSVIDEVENWGPTRGSYADDQAFLDRVRAQWQHPTGAYGRTTSPNGTWPVATRDGIEFVTHPRPEDLTGDVQVLYAGQTPDGPAAVVAQRGADRDVGYYFGVLLPSSHTDLRLVAAYRAQLSAQPAGAPSFDTHVISFQTTAAGAHAVILPANPVDTILISTQHTLGADKQVHRDWTAIRSQGGVAELAAPTKLGFSDTRIRIVRDGQVLDESNVESLLPGVPSQQSAAPGNAIPTWTGSSPGGVLAGLHNGAGYPRDLYQIWVRQFGAPDEPYGGSHWEFSGQLPDRSSIIVEQLWLYGDPAHTVVFRATGDSAQILYDAVTDSAARPLLLLKLPDQQGWLFVGGPNTTIHGYREPGANQWSSIDISTDATSDGQPVTTRYAAVIPSQADHLQVQIIVDGHQRIASA